MAGLDINTNLLLHFNGNTGAKEIVDSGNTGHVVTQVVTAQLDTAVKKFGSSSLSLDGDSDYLTIPYSPDFDIIGSLSGSYSVSLWVRAADSLDGAILNQNITNIDRFQLVNIPSSQLTVFWKDTSGWFLLAGNGYQIVDTNWHHIAIVRVGSDVGVYLDGAQIAYGSATRTFSVNSPLYIGNEVESPNYFFNGNIDELMFKSSNYFNAAPNVGKTDTIAVPTNQHTTDANTKLLLHMDSLDVSGDGGSGLYHIPKFNVTAQLDTAQKKLGSASLSLDGDSDYLTIPNSPDFDFGAGDFTIDFWIKTDIGFVAGGAPLTYKKSGNPADIWKNGWQFYRNSGDEKLFFYFGNSVGQDILVLSANSDISDGLWHHIAVVKNGTILTSYLDGTQKGQRTDVVNPQVSGSEQGLYVGFSDRITSYFNGNLDEIRISKGIARWTSNFTPPVSEYSYEIILAALRRNQAIIII